MTTTLGIATVLLATLVVFAATPWVARAARVVGALDLPGARKVHRYAVPRLGGAGVALGLLAGTGFAVALGANDRWVDDGTLTGLAVAGLLVFAVGALDDVHRLGAAPKFAVQLVAAYWAWRSGVRIEAVTVPWTGESAALGAWSLPLTLLWLVLVTNAWNLIDGLDGLAAMLGLVAAGIFAAMLLVRHADADLILILPLLGALLGFLPHNWYPARIFLGDSGSYLIGFHLAAVSILTGQKGVTSFAVFGPLAILGLPIVDTSLAVARRLLRPDAGPLSTRLKGVFQADREHLHHRAIDRGWSSPKAVVVLASFGAMLGGAGLLMTFVRSPRLAALVALVAVLLVLMLYSHRDARALAVHAPDANPAGNETEATDDPPS